MRLSLSNDNMGASIIYKPDVIHSVISAYKNSDSSVSKISRDNGLSIGAMYKLLHTSKEAGYQFEWRNQGFSKSQENRQRAIADVADMLHANQIGETHFSVSDMAENVGRAESTVRQYIKDLNDTGYETLTFTTNDDSTDFSTFHFPRSIGNIAATIVLAGAGVALSSCYGLKIDSELSSKSYEKSINKLVQSEPVYEDHFHVTIDQALEEQIQTQNTNFMETCTPDVSIDASGINYDDTSLSTHQNLELTLASSSSTLTKFQIPDVAFDNDIGETFTIEEGTIEEVADTDMARRLEVYRASKPELDRIRNKYTKDTDPLHNTILTKQTPGGIYDVICADFGIDPDTSPIFIYNSAIGYSILLGDPPIKVDAELSPIEELIDEPSEQEIIDRHLLNEQFRMKVGQDLPPSEHPLDGLAISEGDLILPLSLIHGVDPLADRVFAFDRFGGSGLIAADGIGKMDQSWFLVPKHLEHLYKLN